MRVVLLLLVVLNLTACSLWSSPPPPAPLSLAELPSYKNYRAARQQVVHKAPVKKLPSPPLELTAEVKRELQCYLKGNGRYVKESLDRRNQFYPILAEIFEDEGVPHDLLNLAMVESGYNIQAKSQVGAVGMWQFMKSTAQVYGLSVGVLEDERKDPILSTIAAARHLKDLYNLYKDWYLALAAYNAGPGAVQRAVSKTGTADFWSLARNGKFSKQTRDFVPRFIAATLIARDPSSFGLSEEEPPVEETAKASLAMDEQLSAPPQNYSPSL